MYKVLENFVDREDNFHMYVAGDVYPRNGVVPSSERVKALLSGENLVGKALIVDEKPDTSVEEEAESNAVEHEQAEPEQAEAEQEEAEQAEPEKKPEYTAEEITSMNFLKLKKLAKELGVDIEGKKAPEVRQAVIERL